MFINSNNKFISQLKLLDVAGYIPEINKIV